MFKPTTLIVCDICGKTEDAVVEYTHGNNTPWCSPPPGWTFARANRNVHLCPECASKLQAVTRHD